jgi:cell division protein FtsZ
MKLEEFSQIGKLVTENIAMEAQVIIGARINKDFEGRVRVITIMTGVSSPYILGKQRIQDYAVQPTNQEFNELGIDYVNN